MAERYKMDGESSEVACTRAAIADRNDAFNELRAVRVDSAAARVQQLNAQADGEQAAAARALEVGNYEEHAKRQRNLSELAVQRAQAEHEQQYFEAQPVHPRDPVEALIQSRAHEPLTQKWLREHPSDALALATGCSPRRQAKILASDADARAQGYATGTPEYFRHVEKFLGMTSGSESAKRVVHVVKAGQAANGDDQLTPGEYAAATDGTLCWGYEGGAKRGTALGVEEYLRRRNIQRKQPGWFDKLD
jgi:hypothetical protein